MMERIQKGLFFYEDEDEKRKIGLVTSKVPEVFLKRNEGRKMYTVDRARNPDFTIERFDEKTYKRKSDGFFPIDDNCETEKRLGICKIQVSSNDDDDKRERTRCNITFCLFV